MKRLVFVVALATIVGSGSLMAAEPVVGKWKTVDDKSGKVKSEVELYEQGGKVFGKIVGLAEPNDQAGKPQTCTRCTGGDKDKPIVGLVIIRDLAPDNGRYKGGTILDPEDGKVYKAEIWAEGGTLKVRGYVGLFYKTQSWVK